MRRLLIGVVIVAALAGAAVIGYSVWEVRRVHRKFFYTPKSAAVLIADPTLPEPADNGFDELAAAAALLEPESDAIGQAYESAWDTDSEEARRLLRVCAEPLRRAREALGGDCLQPRPAGFEDPLSHLADLRCLARLMVLEGRRHERERRCDEAAGCYGDMLRLATVAGRNGGVIHALVDCAIVGCASADLSRCVGSGAMSKGALARLADELDRAMADGLSWHDALAMEWLEVQEWLAEVEMGKVDLDGNPGPGSPTAVPAETLTIIQSTRAEMNDKQAPAIEDAKKPYWQRSYRAPEPETLLGELVVPDFSKGAQKLAIRDALLRGARVHVAAQLFAQEQGALPASVGDLVPEYLDEVPSDPFDGEPLRYARTDSGCVVYSVGPDREDGSAAQRLDRETDAGDIIIWPWGGVLRRREEVAGTAEE